MSRQTRRLRPLHAILATALLPAAAAWAQPSQGPEEPRTWLTVEAMAGHWRMQTRGDTFDPFSPPATDGFLSGTRINTETDLGLPRNKLVAGIAFGRRIGQHWRIEVNHTTGKREGSAVLARSLTVDGRTYDAGTTLESRVGVSTLAILGGWSTQPAPGTEAGVLVGGQWVRVSRWFHTQGSSLDFASSNHETAPVPVVGAFAHHQLTPQWRLDGRLTASRSSNYQATAGVQWRAHRNLALGAAYRVTRHRLDVESITLIGWAGTLVVDATIHGPMFTVMAAF